MKNPVCSYKSHPQKGLRLHEKRIEKKTITPYECTIMTCTFHPRVSDAPHRTVAAAIFSSSEPLIAIPYIFSISAKLRSNPRA